MEQLLQETLVRDTAATERWRGKSVVRPHLIHTNITNNRRLSSICYLALNTRNLLCSEVSALMFWSLIRKHYHPRVWEGHGRTREFFICRQMRLKLLPATAVIRIIWILGLGSCVGTLGSLGRAAAASPASLRSGWRMRTLFTRLLSAFIMNIRLRLDTLKIC